MKKATILSGIDRLQLADEQLRGRRVGLMTNPTVMNRELKSTIAVSYTHLDVYKRQTDSL